VSRRTLAGAAILAALVAVGTALDRRHVPQPGSATVLEADLHVHPFPGDGVLTVGELRHEAERRGLDVIAVTAHNNRVGLDFAPQRGDDPGGVIVLPGQEITAPGFHIVAVGIDRLIDWRLNAADAIASIHAQGGVALAAHPVRSSWRESDPSAVGLLDGAEVAHPGRQRQPAGDDEYLEFFELVRARNPSVAPIGSSDFHTTAPLGLCRTYLLVQERSPAGALEAIRQGRTVARSPNGELHGHTRHVDRVEAHLSGRHAVPSPSRAERLVALGVLGALAVLVAPPLRRRQ